MDNEKKELNKEVEKTITILDATHKNIDVTALNSINITNALIIGDCIFYVANTKLTEDQINKIKLYQEQNNGIELCQEMFQRKSINYFKLNSKTQQIFYKEVNKEDIKKEAKKEVNKEENEKKIKEEAKKDGILVKGTSKEYNTLYLKLIKCHTDFIKNELRKEKEKREKSNEEELSTDSDDFGIIGGLPPRLISEYARIENGGQIIKTIKARDEKFPTYNRAHLLILDAVEKLIQEEIKPQEEEQEGNEDTLLNIHSSNTTTNNNGSTIIGTNPTTVNSDDNPHSTTIQTPASESSTNINGDNNNNKSFDGYILGTPLHVSSFLLKSNIEPKKYYLFDTTGHTHQSKVSLPVKNNEQNAVFTEKDNQIKDNNKAEDNIRQYFETQLQLSDKILSDRNAVSLFTNKDNTPIKVISLNPFGLNYQNGSSACGIWSANVSAEALKHDKIVDFIMEDTKDKEHILAMFKSEFILKAAARVARKFNDVNAEIQEETQGEINEVQRRIIAEGIDAQIDTDNSNNEEDNDSDNNKYKDNSNNDRGSNNNGNNDVIVTGNNNIKREADTMTYCKCKLGNSLFLIDTQYKQDSCLNMDNVLLSISEEELKYNNENGINNDIINKIEELKKELKEQYDNLENKILKENGKVLIDNFKEFLPELLNSYGIDEKIFNSKSDAQKEHYIKGYYKTKKQELKNQIRHAETIDRLFRQSKGLDNEQLDGKQLLSSEQLNSGQIQNELLDNRQSSNRQLSKNQIQSEKELKIQQPEQLQSQEEKKKQQDIQLEKEGKLDREELLLSIEEALSEMEKIKEKENNKNGRNK